MDFSTFFVRLCHCDCICGTLAKFAPAHLKCRSRNIRNLKRLIARYLGLPSGEELRFLRKALRYIEVVGKTSPRRSLRGRISDRRRIVYCREVLGPDEFQRHIQLAVGWPCPVRLLFWTHTSIGTPSIYNWWFCSCNGSPSKDSLDIIFHRRLGPKILAEARSWDSLYLHQAPVTAILIWIIMDPFLDLCTVYFIGTQNNIVLADV